jgi:hypothetical protein
MRLLVLSWTHTAERVIISSIVLNNLTRRALRTPLSRTTPNSVWRDPGGGQTTEGTRRSLDRDVPAEAQNRTPADISPSAGSSSLRSQIGLFQMRYVLDGSEICSRGRRIAATGSNARRQAVCLLRPPKNRVRMGACFPGKMTREAGGDAFFSRIGYMGRWGGRQVPPAGSRAR